jgi:tetratricopeptide (TPR) repeat protein
VLKTEQNNAALYNLHGNAYQQKRDYDLAAADYNEAVRIDPKYAIAYQNLACLHREIDERHLGLAKDYQRKAVGGGEQIADKR